MVDFSNYKIAATGGVSIAEIEAAEKELGFKFSPEFCDYLQEYGSIKLNGNELFGLGVGGYRNVVVATLRERSLSSRFPLGYCVVYNLGVDSVLILLGSDGCVYEYTPVSLKKIFNSFNHWVLEEFVDM